MARYQGQYVRRDVLREPLPHKDADEDAPEEDAPLLLEEDALAAVHGVEKLHLRHEERVHGPCRVDEVVACEACEPVPNELRGDEPTRMSAPSARTRPESAQKYVREDGDGGVDGDVVIEVLGCKHRNGGRLV